MYEDRLRIQNNQNQARQKEPNVAGNRRLGIALNKGNNDTNASASGGTGNANGTNGVAGGGPRTQQTAGPQGSGANPQGSGSNPQAGGKPSKKKERTAEEEEDDLKNRVYCLYAVQRSAQPVIAKAGMLTFSGPHGMSKNASR